MSVPSAVLEQDPLGSAKGDRSAYQQLYDLCQHCRWSFDLQVASLPSKEGAVIAVVVVDHRAITLAAETRFFPKLVIYEIPPGERPEKGVEHSPDSATGFSPSVFACLEQICAVILYRMDLYDLFGEARKSPKCPKEYGKKKIAVVDHDKQLYGLAQLAFPR